MLWAVNSVCLFLEETHYAKMSHRKLNPSWNESHNASFLGFAQQSIFKITQTCFITAQKFCINVCSKGHTVFLYYTSHLSLIVCVFSQNVKKEDHVEYAPIATRRWSNLNPSLSTRTLKPPATISVFFFSFAIMWITTLKQDHPEEW